MANPTAETAVNRIVRTVQAWPSDSPLYFYQRWALALVDEVVMLRAKLVEFAVHKGNCATKRRTSDPCDCGMIEAIQRAHSGKVKS